MTNLYNLYHRQLLLVVAEADEDNLGLNYTLSAFIRLADRLVDLLVTSLAMANIHLYQTLAPIDGLYLWDTLHQHVTRMYKGLFSANPDFSPLLRVELRLEPLHAHPYDCPYRLQLHPTFKRSPQIDEVGALLAHFLEDYYLFVKRQVTLDTIAREYLKQAMRRISNVYATMLDATPPSEPHKPVYLNDERLLSIEGELTDLWRRSVSSPPKSYPTLADLLSAPKPLPMKPDHKRS